MRKALGSKVALYIVLGLGAVAFLFPFYYMVVGSFQTDVDPTIAGAFPEPSNLTTENYVAINERINLFQGLLNSGIFTGGVLLGTLVFGVLAGYGLAVLKWRGRGVTFALVLHGTALKVGLRVQNALGIFKLFVLALIALSGLAVLLHVPGFRIDSVSMRFCHCPGGLG